MFHEVKGISECLRVWSSSWWNQHSSAFSTDSSQQMSCLNFCPASTPLSRRVFSITRDIKLSQILHKGTTGCRNQSCSSTQQRKTACRIILHTFQWMSGVKYTCVCTVGCMGDMENQHREGSERYGRISPGKGVSDIERRSQQPSWELIWVCSVSRSFYQGSQMLPFTGGRLWDAVPAQW